MRKETPQSLTDIVTLDVRDRLGPLASVITFACEKDLGFNARVTSPSDGAGIWHIEFGYDLVYGFELVCQAALANSSCLRDIGKPDGEVDWYHQLSIAPDWADPGTAFRQILAEVGDIKLRPACATRWDFAQRVRTHMLDFVLFHELGHIWHRHLGPSQQRVELGRRQARDGGDHDFEQAMEMHADSVAVILGFMRAREFRHESPLWRRAWGLGDSLVLYLLGAFDSAESLAGESHPHAAVRLVHARISSVAYPGFGLSQEDWDAFSDDLLDVARHLDIGSAANPFMAERFHETMAEYSRMHEHFVADADGGGLGPPQVLVDLMKKAREAHNR